MFVIFKLKKKNTATEVACGWAGAITEVTRPFGQEQWGQRNKIKSSVTDGPTDRLTDQPTDEPTNRWTDKASYRDMWMHLKTTINTTVCLDLD